MLTDRRGSKNSNWRGGQRKNGDYVVKYMPNHPFKSKANYVAEHRLMMEERLREKNPNHPALIEIDGVKYLKRDWVVHHKNRKKDDNKIDNFELMLKKEHDAMESTGRKKSVETRRKMALKKRGERNPMYGKTGINSPLYGRTPTLKTRQKMREKKINRYIGENNPFYGKHHTVENKLKLSELHKNLKKNRGASGRFVKRGDCDGSILQM